MSPNETTLINSNSNSLLSRCWNGEIKLWKAFWLVHVLGLIIAFAIGLSLQMATLYILNARLPGIANAIPLLIYGVFAMVTLWRSSPNPKQSILGALVRVWVVAFSFYILSTSYRFSLLW